MANNNFGKKKNFDSKKVSPTNVKCPNCGRVINELPFGWGCSGFRDGCGVLIYKDDFFFKSLGKKMTKTMAFNLLRGKVVDLKDCVSKGKQFDASVSFEKKDDGKWGYNIDFH